MAYELFMDGFDYYATADITKKWQEIITSSSVYVISPGTGRRSGGALEVKGFPNFGGVIKTKTFMPSEKIVIGFAMNVTANGRGVITRFYSGGVLQFSIGMNNSSQFFSQRGTAPIHATSVNSFPLNSYQYVEIGVHLADSGGYEVRVNGSTEGWFSFTSYDTLVTAGAKIDQVWLERVPNVGDSVYLDDLYIAYGDEIKFLGDSRIDTLTLTGNSSPQDWVPDTGNAWERLNQTAGYIASGSPGASSLFSLSNLPHDPESIYGVQVNAHVSKSDAGSRTISSLLKTGNLTTVGQPLALATDTLLMRSAYSHNPATQAAFLKSDVEALEVGVRVAA